jgi:hypothetical protein
MVDGTSSRETLLTDEFHRQTAHIRWHDLQTYYAKGDVVNVASELDLVAVAVALAMDNTDQFQAWIDAGDIASVTEHQAQLWFDQNPALWAVVAAPWVLVQSK